MQYYSLLLIIFSLIAIPGNSADAEQKAPALEVLTDTQVYHLAQDHGGISGPNGTLGLLDIIGHPDLDQRASFDFNKFLHGFSVELRQDFLTHLQHVYESQSFIYDWLAKKLKENPEIEVYNELMYSVPSFKHKQCRMIRRKMSNFSKNNATEEQILILSEYRAAEVLYCTGKLKHLRPGDDKELHQRALANSVDSMLSDDSLAFAGRERWVVDQIIKQAKTHRPHEVVIIYGAFHDFSRHFGPETKFNRIDTISRNTLPNAEFHLRFHRFFKSLKFSNPFSAFMLGHILAPLYEPIHEAITKLQETSLIANEAEKEKNLFEYSKTLFRTGTISIDKLISMEEQAELVKACSAPTLDEAMTSLIPFYSRSLRWNSQNHCVELDL